MPRREDIKKILIIGAGPIVIGQACEFDYSGAQACKSLKEEGYEVILVNSNPATIMTDPDLSDKTYIEPITKDFVEQIIEIEKPDALLPTMGGQTALNVSMELAKSGILKKYKVKMIGANPDAIELAEDRQKFKDAMREIGLKCPESVIVEELKKALEVKERLRLPLVIRPSFTLGGTGGGVAYTDEEFSELCQRGLNASPTNQILRNASIKVLQKIGVDTGGSNVQFAINPEDGEINVIEMNPRVSRSSALASKATGFPIAKIAAKLAVGYSLDELKNDITKTTPASFEPTIDYVVTKIPRFTFEKFAGADSNLTTSMKSVGETMSIGRSFNESLQKGFSSLEYGLNGLDVPQKDNTNTTSIIEDLKIQSSQRLLTIGQALRLDIHPKEINKITKYDKWFIYQLKKIIEIENLIKDNQLSKEIILLSKQNGFTDKKIAKLKNISEKNIRKFRHQNKIKPIFRLVDTCAGEFTSKTPYLYSSYDWNYHNKPYCESNPTNKKKIIILGGGPNRIGQGIEFDYCCVHAVYALKEKGIETIMINCNPETVSTDYDTADRLYFEPLTTESVLEIYKKEDEKGEVLGIFVQFGGQTPLKIANELENEGIKILGTTTEAIDLAEDRDRFSATLKKLKIEQPKNGFAKNLNQAIKIAEEIKYPVLVRPSYVLGGRAMQIAYNKNHLESFTKSALEVSSNNIILVDQYLENATEIDVDLIRDCKGNVFIAGIMEHIEEAGIHSGDSACSLPPFSISKKIQNKIIKWVSKIAEEINVIGLMNTQLAIKNDDVYVLEVNPRASRTVPFVAKARGIPIAKIAAKVMTGDLLDDVLNKNDFEELKTYNVKESVFPFNKFDGVDLVLGPEMKSTGEVMGIDSTFLSAFAKSQIACGTILPSKGKVFISIDDDNKKFILDIVNKLINLNFNIVATKGTSIFLNNNNLNVETINKVKEGGPHIVDSIKENKIDLVINTTKTQGSIRDSYSIRRTALTFNIPYYTTIPGAKVAVDTIEHLKNNSLKVRSLQDLV